MTTIFKKTFIATISLVALASCGSNEIDNQLTDSYIIFGRPSVALDCDITPMSRAQLMTNVDQFTVWSYCRPRFVNGGFDDSRVADEWNDKSIFFTGIPDIFNGQEVTLNASGDPYYGNAKAWPYKDEARYAFIGAASSNSNMVKWEMTPGSIVNNYGPQLKFTINRVTDGSLATAMDYREQPDAMIAAIFNHQVADGRVDLTFSHFMTGLRFKFHNHTANNELVIKKVTFEGEFYKEAVFDFTNEKIKMSLTGDKYDGVFTLLDGSQSIAAGTSDYLGGDNPVNVLLLPNPNAVLDENDANDEWDKRALGTKKTIKITYTIGGGADRTYELKTFKLNYIPEMNTLHTANFNFVGDDFVVLFQADNNTTWANGSDNEIEIH